MTEDWISSLGSVPGALWANAVFFVFAYLAGRIITARLCLSEGAGAVLLRLVAGLNISALILFLFAVSGVFGFIRPIHLLYALIVLAAGFQLRSLKSDFQLVLCREARINLAVLILLALLFLGASLSPPLGWDEMVYHHSVVQRWIADGRPFFYADLPYSAFPSANSFIYWMLAESGTVIASRLFIWLCWCISIMLIVETFRECGLRGFCSFALAMSFAFSQSMLFVMSDAYAETILVLNTSGMLLMLARRYSAEDHAATRDGGMAVVFLCGILAGGAAAVKLTGIVLFTIPAVLIAFKSFDLDTRNKKYDAARSIFVLFATGALIALPFYIRPLMATGNPFYPYFCEWFNGSPAQAAMSEFHHKISSVKFGHRSLPMFFAGPMAISLSDNTFDGSYGWQFLLVIGIVVAGLVSGKERMIYLTGFLGLAMYVIWFFSAQQARFFLPGVLTLYVCAGIFIGKLRSSYQKTAASALFVLALLSFPWRASGYYYYSWSQLLGKTRRIDFVHTGTGDGFLEAVEAVIHLTPEDSIVMMMFEHRIMYFPRMTVIGTPYFQEQYFTPADRFTECKEIFPELLNSGAGYLLVAMYPEGPDVLPEYVDENRKFAEHFSKLIPEGRLVEVWRSRTHSLFEVR